MIRANNLSRIAQRRTLRPTFSNMTSIPHAEFYDVLSVGRTIVVPGMVCTRSLNSTIRIAGVDDKPCGFFNNFINGPLDELGDGTEIGVWSSGEFELIEGGTESPFDTSIAWQRVAHDTPLYSNDKGQLTTEIGVYPVAKMLSEGLIGVVGTRKIIVTTDVQPNVYLLGYEGKQDEKYINDLEYRMGTQDRLGDLEIEVWSDEL